jgi:hypothetical protein
LAISCILCNEHYSIARSRLARRAVRDDTCNLNRGGGVCSSHGQADEERDGAEFVSKKKVRAAMRFHHQAFYNPGSIRLEAAEIPARSL